MTIDLGTSEVLQTLSILGAASAFIWDRVVRRRERQRERLERTLTSITKAYYGLAAGTGTLPELQATLYLSLRPALLSKLRAIVVPEFWEEDEEEIIQPTIAAVAEDLWKQAHPFRAALGKGPPLYWYWGHRRKEVDERLGDR